MKRLGFSAFQPLLAVSLLLLTSCGTAVPPDGQADWIFTGGQVVTVDDDFSLVEAVAVKDGRIVSVGSAREVGTFQGPGTQVVHLEGRSLIPGLQDSHIHFLSLGHDVNYEAELTFAMTAEEIVAEIVALKERLNAGPGEWLIGNRWDQYKYPEMVTRWQLDEVTPENPVLLNRVYRGVAVNSLVFEMMGIDDNDPSTWPDWWLEDPPNLTFEDKIFRAPRTLTINGQEREYTIPTGAFVGSRASRLAARPGASRDRGPVGGSPVRPTPSIPSRKTSRACIWEPWRCSPSGLPASWIRRPASATT